MPENLNVCRLCGMAVRQDTRQIFDRDIYEYYCQRCGDYQITRRACITPDLPVSLRCATRQVSEAGQRILLTVENLNDYATQHATTSVVENVEKLLLFIQRKCPRPSQKYRFLPATDYTVIDCTSEDELMFFVDHLEQKGWATKQSGCLELTMAGWEYLSGPTGPGWVEGRCFAALSFQRLDIYDFGIKPAIVGAGYVPICMSEVATNEDINFRILTEIRKAQFVVADFTEQRGGVYFEAGFARALGREVFWTCAREEERKVHFDTNHFQHIFWKDTKDLAAQLEEKILAVFGARPGHQKQVR